MTNPPGAKRVDTGSRLVRATPAALYRALVDPEAVVAWLPPAGMTGRLLAFEARVGGAFRMELRYEGSDPSDPSAPRGKTSEDTDLVEGSFVELAPDERVAQRFEFRSGDPAFAGAMTMTWTFTPAAEGTRVTITAEDVPAGIRREDHEAAFRSTLENLAAFVE